MRIKRGQGLRKKKRLQDPDEHLRVIGRRIAAAIILANAF